MNAGRGGRLRFGQRLGRGWAAAWALLAAGLLALGLAGCGSADTPGASDATARPTATVAPAGATRPAEDGPPPGAGLVLQVAVAPVAAGLPDYERKHWRHWIDADGDCQHTRNEVLIAESAVPAQFASEEGCRVESGWWTGPYTGESFTGASEVDVDHMVPLANAHRSGGWAWSRERKGAYANALGYDNHLLVTSRAANRAKGDKGPEGWRPPLEGYWCVYAVDWIAIKNAWGLTVTEAEYAASAGNVVDLPGAGVVASDGRGSARPVLRRRRRPRLRQCLRLRRCSRIGPGMRAGAGSAVRGCRWWPGGRHLTSAHCRRRRRRLFLRRRSYTRAYSRPYGHSYARSCANSHAGGFGNFIGRAGVAPGLRGFCRVVGGAEFLS